MLAVFSHSWGPRWRSCTHFSKTLHQLAIVGGLVHSFGLGTSPGLQQYVGFPVPCVVGRPGREQADPVPHSARGWPPRKRPTRPPASFKPPPTDPTSHAEVNRG